MGMKGKVGTTSFTNGSDLDDILAVSMFRLCRPLWVSCPGKRTEDPKLLLREDPAEKCAVQMEFCQKAFHPHPPQANEHLELFWPNLVNFL